MIEARCHDSPARPVSVAGALAQLEYVESVLPSVQLSTQQLEAWVEFLDRGRRHDA
jgi:hypothetical protein